MKRFAILMLLITFVFSNTEFHELFKLPVLIGHYIEHKENDKDVSFVDFIKLHYSHSSKQSASEHEHDRLPFKTDTCSQTTLTEIKFDSDFSLQHIYPFEKKMLSAYKNILYHLNTASGIWQPPRVA